ncbi:spore germination protein KA [Halobacillus andaensis]|uniref:Spore germination protein KA n=1 Tax=Halobacillus andaensis TaxID=1176239 RepID=A0A917B6W9_HALAA|nr:spore germination protein [Halobacillus andaensis]MBP2005715.1 spore germination protein KA [Halobacillus andaensis]GGF26546.1 spore germination protein KA [Halobacillus andaensis]
MWRKNSKNVSPTNQTDTTLTITEDVEQNIEQIKHCLGDPFDLVYKEYKFKRTAFALCYIDGLISTEDLERTVIPSLMDWFKENDSSSGARDFSQHIQVPKKLNTTSDFSIMLTALLRGSTILFIKKGTEAFLISDQHWETRSIEEPSSQTMVRGPREGFVEALAVNSTLIRRRITNPRLRFKSFIVGEMTQTMVMVIYIEGLVNESALNVACSRITNAKASEIFETGMLEELIEDKGYSPFPTLIDTERPDVVSAALTEGKLAIMMEGSPFALIGPATFISYFQTAEDYYNRFDLSTFLRMIRFIAFWIAFALPATYVALTTFHQELIPTDLLISLAAQREGLPFPAIVEALIMETVFEILREAGIRMPRPIGPAVSIVGAIVIGEAAVTAGLVSPAIVIVVSLTAIASFANPYYSIAGSARIMRFVLMLFAATAGIFGILIFTLILCIHLVSLRSLGEPYMSPFAPFSMKKQKDTVVRFPMWWSKRKKRWKQEA